MALCVSTATDAAPTVGRLQLQRSLGGRRTRGDEEHEDDERNVLPDDGQRLASAKVAANALSTKGLASRSWDECLAKTGLPSRSCERSEC
jgi:hypothetical protein